MLTAETTALTFTTDADLRQLCWARLAEAVLARDLAHVAYWQWPSSLSDLGPLEPYALASYRGTNRIAMYVDLEERVGDTCLAAVWLGRGVFGAWVAAASRELVTSADTWLSELAPRVEPSDDRRVPVSFWTCGSYGGSASSRTIDVPEWAASRANYPAPVRGEVDALMARTSGPDRAGQLILWHGPPGTGKTSALRALAWEWRAWCELHYVTDPDALFGSSAEYLMDVLLDEDDEDDDRKWRLLALEDTGELLADDAKRQTGQGLSRLLNVVDGIVGQGLRLLVLVTTNELVGSLHPAVTRPGRCLASIEFPPFSTDEATAWLTANGHREPAARSMTLAELYAVLAGETPMPSVRPRVGFVV